MNCSRVNESILLEELEGIARKYRDAGIVIASAHFMWDGVKRNGVEPPLVVIALRDGDGTGK